MNQQHFHEWLNILIWTQSEPHLVFFFLPVHYIFKTKVHYFILQSDSKCKHSDKNKNSSTVYMHQAKACWGQGDELSFLSCCYAEKNKSAVRQQQWSCEGRWLHSLLSATAVTNSNALNPPYTLLLTLVCQCDFSHSFLSAIHSNLFKLLINTLDITFCDVLNSCTGD